MTLVSHDLALLEQADVVTVARHHGQQPAMNQPDVGGGEAGVGKASRASFRNASRSQRDTLSWSGEPSSASWLVPSIDTSRQGTTNK